LWASCFLAALATAVVLFSVVAKRRCSRQREFPATHRGDANADMYMMHSGSDADAAVVVDPERVHLLAGPVESYGAQK
jgi:hypothetical protein